MACGTDAAPNSTCGRNEKYVQHFWSIVVKEIDNLRELGIEGNIMFKINVK